MEPMLIIAALVVGGIAAFGSGLIARRRGPLWGAVIPGLVIAFTLYSTNMKVHPEGGMGQGMLVVFILWPLSAVTTLGWVVGLVQRQNDRRRQRR